MTAALLLTRPRAQSEAFAADVARHLPGRFAPVLIAPLLEIEPVPQVVRLEGVQALLFTSANGVEAFAAASPDRTLPALCVGAITAAAARAHGFRARSADGDVAALAALAAAAWRPGAGALLHIRGRHAAGDLTGALAARGIPARAAELYDQVPRPLPAAAHALLASGVAVVAPMFSPRTARLFARETEGLDLAGLTVVGLSEATVAPIPAARRIVATAPGRDGLLAALRDA
jgi:uroporphyrinogen-III synthase